MIEVCSVLAMRLTDMNVLNYLGIAPVYSFILSLLLLFILSNSSIYANLSDRAVMEVLLRNGYGEWQMYIWSIPTRCRSVSSTFKDYYS